MSSEVDAFADSKCRSCGAKRLREFLSLGPLPLTDAYVPPDRARESQSRYPLEVAFCPGCTLVQILRPAPTEGVFEEYSYYSSVSETLLAHSREHAQGLIASRKLDSNSLVIEVASNDGYLLRTFAEAGVPVLGIDPARGPAEVAEALGIHTMRTFFSEDLGKRLRSDGNEADLLIANNVLAHVPDLNGFVEGIAVVLAEGGIAEIEVPYVRDLIDNLEFDTIYHEHLCYFSVSALAPLFRRHGLSLNGVQHLPIHGGSLRLTVGRRVDVSDSVRAWVDEETAVGLNGFEYYRGFAGRVAGLQQNLRTMLEGLRHDGMRIAAYGAAAKGTVLLNSSRIDADIVDFVADKSPHKQGLLLPGVAIPITSPDRILQEKPDYVLVLSWNLLREIVNELRSYLESGGRFILPIPTPRVLGSRDLASVLSGELHA